MIVPFWSWNLSDTTHVRSHTKFQLIWAINTAFSRGGTMCPAPSVKCEAGTPSVLGLKTFTFSLILIVRGKHPHCTKKASLYSLVLHTSIGSSFWQPFTLWSSPRYDSVTLISFTAFRLYFPSPINLIGSRIFFVKLS